MTRKRPCEPDTNQPVETEHNRRGGFKRKPSKLTTVVIAKGNEPNTEVAGIIRHPFIRQIEPVRLTNFEPSRTRQEFRDECDINFIMRKFQRDGVITHLAKYGQHYGEASECDLMDALETLRTAEEMWHDLPSQVRKEFDSPTDFVKFTENAENVDRLREWGLTPPAADPTPVRVEVTNADFAQNAPKPAETQED